MTSKTIQPGDVVWLNCYSVTRAIVANVEATGFRVKGRLWLQPFSEAYDTEDDAIRARIAAAENEVKRCEKNLSLVRARLKALRKKHAALLGVPSTPTKE